MTFDNQGVFFPFKTDLQTLNIIKIRDEKECKRCYKKIPKGSYCLGGGGWFHSRTCLNCGKPYFEKAIKSVREFLEYIKFMEKEFKKNKRKHKLHNISAKI